MPDYILGQERLKLRPADAVGKGGEADVFIEGGRAIKIFKPPSHQDFSGDLVAQSAAKKRIEEHQEKLRAFPHGLPARVVAPEELVFDTKGKIAGYAMKPLTGAEVLYRYGERSFRDAGVSDEAALAVLADLRNTVEATHRKNFVFGDFNDLNVLVKGREAYVIDADSGQFGPYYTSVFTAKFVDPLVCDPKGNGLMMMRPHNQNSDWYAYAVMLMQTLLFVGPYGGVYLPKDPKKRLPHDRRPLARVTVFDPEVKYPKPARPYGILPDTMLDYFERTFRKDERGVTPSTLVESVRFTTCTKCGTHHARAVCPSCVQATPPMLKEIHKGGVTAIKEFSTSGVVLAAALEHDTNFRFIYHEADGYRREGGVKFADGALDPHFRFRISGAKTVMGRGNQAFIFEGENRDSLPVEAYRLLPQFDANAKHIFFVRDGALRRIGKLGLDYTEHWGSVLPNQTLFWVGERNGFGFYRAGEVSNYFVFDTEHPGINDSIKLPPIRGKLVNATCSFGSDRIWFFVTTAENGKTINRCHVLEGHGTYIASGETEAGDGSWLSSLRGKYAVNDLLFSATDDGLVRIKCTNGTLAVEKEYPATADYLTAETPIFLGKQGLYAVQRDTIWRLVLA